MPDRLHERGCELRHLGRLAQRLCDAGRHEDETFVDRMLGCSTSDHSVSEHMVKRLRALVDEAEGVM